MVSCPLPGSRETKTNKINARQIWNQLKINLLYHIWNQFELIKIRFHIKSLFWENVYTTLDIEMFSLSSIRFDSILVTCVFMDHVHVPHHVLHILIILTVAHVLAVVIIWETSGRLSWALCAMNLKDYVIIITVNNKKTNININNIISVALTNFIVSSN